MKKFIQNTAAASLVLLVAGATNVAFAADSVNIAHDKLYPFVQGTSFSEHCLT